MITNTVFQFKLALIALGLPTSPGSNFHRAEGPQDPPLKPLPIAARLAGIASLGIWFVVARLGGRSRISDVSMDLRGTNEQNGLSISAASQRLMAAHSPMHRAFAMSSEEEKPCAHCGSCGCHAGPACRYRLRAGATRLAVNADRRRRRRLHAAEPASVLLLQPEGNDARQVECLDEQEEQQAAARKRSPLQASELLTRQARPPRGARPRISDQRTAVKNRARRKPAGQFHKGCRVMPRSHEPTSASTRPTRFSTGSSPTPPSAPDNRLSAD